jgi:hypothetical protein
MREVGVCFYGLGHFGLPDVLLQRSCLDSFVSPERRPAVIFAGLIGLSILVCGSIVHVCCPTLSLVINERSRDARNF